MSNNSILDEIAAFERESTALETQHLGKWVLFQGGKLAGVFDNFDAAAADAVSRFGRGPYLIRQVGQGAVTLPASVMYGPFHAIDPLRI